MTERPTIIDPSATINDPSPTINYPSATVNHPSATINYPSATINDPRPTINYPSATVNYPSATTNYPSATGSIIVGIYPTLTEFAGKMCRYEHTDAIRAECVLREPPAWSAGQLRAHTGGIRTRMITGYVCVYL